VTTRPDASTDGGAPRTDAADEADAPDVADSADSADAADASTVHSPCVPGAALDPSVDTCAATLCEPSVGSDAYCCTTTWDLSCVAVARSHCASACPGGPLDGGVPAFGGKAHGIAQLASRDDALCAVSVEGDVWCWGAENILGDGAEQPVSFPRRMIGLPVPTRTVAMTADAVCALGTDAALRCWGHFPIASASASQPVLTPPSTPILTGVTAVAGDRGLVAQNDFVCAATASGGVRCWGATSSTLGPGVGSLTSIPTSVDLSRADAGPVTEIFAGGAATCALTGDAGVALCWGDNATGMLGHGGLGASPPVLSLGCLPASDADGGPDDCENPLRGITKLALGTSSLCALASDHAVLCLGSDALGALGAGLDGGLFPAPQKLDGVAAIDVAVGGSHACAAPDDASAPVLCWGSNTKGQLGNGFDGGASTRPVAVPGLAGVKQVVAMSSGNCALKTDGTVWCWGADDFGQLGRGTGGGDPSSVPLQVPFLTFP
jgi:hypothetical protein